MELQCQKCGASVSSDQAFCPRCGAVVGMADTSQESGGEWNMAATMVGKKLPTTPPPRPAPRPTPQTSQPSYPSAPAPYPSQPAPVEQAARGSNTVLLAVIGFVAVLIIGGLLILLLYMNMQG
jgi:ribosomal protein S27AE